MQIAQTVLLGGTFIIVFGAVLVALNEGQQYKEVAASLDISINTVRSYVRSIYEKLHVHSKSEAVSKALRSGLIV